MRIPPSVRHPGTFGASLCLAAVLSAVAAGLAVVLATFTSVSEPAIVLAVMTIGFVTSWLLTEFTEPDGVFHHRH